MKTVLESNSMRFYKAKKNFKFKYNPLKNTKLSFIKNLSNP